MSSLTHGSEWPFSVTIGRHLTTTSAHNEVLISVQRTLYATIIFCTATLLKMTGAPQLDNNNNNNNNIHPQFTDSTNTRFSLHQFIYNFMYFPCVAVVHTLHGGGH